MFQIAYLAYLIFDSSLMLFYCIFFYLFDVAVEDFGEFDGFRDQSSDETRTGTGDITPGEFYQLKMAHGGGDPFPMTTTFEVRGGVESFNCLPTVYYTDDDNPI